MVTFGLVLLSSDAKNEGTIVIVKKFDFEFLWTSILYDSRFKEDRFDISNTPSPGRPSWFDEDRLHTLMHNDPHQCTRELAK